MPRPFTATTPITAFCALCLFLSSSISGMDIVQGTARIEVQEDRLSIQAGHNTVLKDVDFSIEPGKAVSIHLPSPSSKIRILVTGDSPSHILGTLQCNGSVVLVNEKGIVIGENGVVRCHEFTASTLAESPSTLYLRSSDNSTAPIVNLGTVQCRKGIFLLTKGCIENTNRLLSPGGHIILSGNIVHIGGKGLVDASDTFGGGKVSVGGGFHGEDPVIQNANLTVVSPEASIRADATEDGEGGSIIVWSNTFTRFLGSISATGKGAGNSGGAVEVSSKKNLDLFGGIDVSATQGKAGSLLLD